MPDNNTEDKTKYAGQVFDPGSALRRSFVQHKQHIISHILDGIFLSRLIKGQIIVVDCSVVLCANDTVCLI